VRWQLLRIGLIGFAIQGRTSAAKPRVLRPLFGWRRGRCVPVGQAGATRGFQDLVLDDLWRSNKQISELEKKKKKKKNKNKNKIQNTEKTRFIKRN
jgi:hypothetical protein